MSELLSVKVLEDVCMVDRHMFVVIVVIVVVIDVVIVTALS